MKYEIRINDAKERKGTISLQRLALIAGSLRKISEGSLQIRLKGVSTRKGPKKIFLEEALNITLTGIKEGSTCLEFETEPFSMTLGSYQLDVFRQESQNYLEEHLPHIVNKPEAFGYQVVVDIDENIVEEIDTLLISALDVSIEDLEQKVHELNGIFIPAHINKTKNSIISQLGFILSTINLPVSPS